MIVRFNPHAPYAISAIVVFKGKQPPAYAEAEVGSIPTDRVFRQPSNHRSRLGNNRKTEGRRMTDAELQGLEVGTIVFHQHGTRIDQFVWDGKPGWFNDPATGAMVYELHDRRDEVITSCVIAADLHKTAEGAIEASTEKRSMPTDEQLEPISRRYCELMGQDPDEIVRIPLPKNLPTATTRGYYAHYSPAPVPYWRSVLPIVRQQVALSIAFGRFCPDRALEGAIVLCLKTDRAFLCQNHHIPGPASTTRFRVRLMVWPLARSWGVLLFFNRLNQSKPSIRPIEISPLFLLDRDPVDFLRIQITQCHHLA